MKIIFTILAMLYFSSIDAQTLIEHVAISNNTDSHITTIDHVATNGIKDAILIVTQKYGVYNDNEIGVWYNSGKWKIFNQNIKPIPENAIFNILVLPKNTKQAFVHTTTSSNTTGHISTLNSSLVNNQSDALVFVTQNYGSYNTSNVGLWYNGGKWKIYNENTKQKIPVGTMFNVLVLKPERNKIGDLNLFAFKYKNNSVGHVSDVNTPLQFTNTTTLFTAQNYSGTYNPNVTGVWRSNGTSWTVFNQNRKTLPKNVQFNVLATNEPIKAAVVSPPPRVINKVLSKNVILPGNKVSEKISYIVKNNEAIFQGDILLGSAENVVDSAEPHLRKRDFSVFRNAEVGSNSQSLIVRQSDGLIEKDWLWPYGIIPYRMRDEFSSSERNLILEAIQEINTSTNLNIVPNNGSYHHIVFFRDINLEGSGQSRIGRVRTPQRVRLNTGFSKRTVIHELLHAAGFWHEQSRSDRDRYVTINWDNIKEDSKHNFEKHSTDGYKVTPYDINSIMHYDGLAFHKNNRPTIIDNRTNSAVISSNVLSAMDIDGINTVYDTDYVTYVTRPMTAIRFVKTTILRVKSADRDGGRKTEIDFYMKNETGAGWNWRPGGSNNSTEKHTSGKVEESDNDIEPNWVFRYAIPRNEEFAKVWLHLRDDDGLSGNERTDEDIDINYFPGIKGVELFIRTSDGQIFLGDIDGIRLDDNYIGQVGEELEVEGYEGPIRAKVTFKIEIE
ncbi:M12 family metallopeptidase [Winogradskyella helgolandensis]|uniref:M12 family metallopeptidase n=1 Tax=Winogradskyella helgolandensis TaxID=2697010 RepID=UPI0015BE53AD|nr:M12 family metallopeptidase [Winogradskyella helgolandensis]